MPSTESYQLLLVAAAACEDKKAEDIRILALDPSESGLTDYFLICNGTNERQNVAITDEVELRLKREFGTYPNSVEGRRQGEWILMDYVDFIVHVFSAEKRAFYGLERLRRSATTISVAELTAEMKALIATTRTRTAKPAVASGNDAGPAKKTLSTRAASKKAIASVAEALGGVESSLSTKGISAKPGKKSAAKKAVVTKIPAKKTTATKSAKSVVKTSAAKKSSAKK